MGIADACRHPDLLDVTHPARPWILFMTNSSELIRTREQKESYEGFQRILPDNTPLELILYLRTIEGLTTVEEMNDWIEQNGGLDQILQTIDLNEQRNTIKVAI